MYSLKSRFPVLFRCLWALLYLLYSDPRMAWAALPRVDDTKPCGMPSCPSSHGGACCMLLERRLEAKHPELRALMLSLERDELAQAARDGGHLRPEHCPGVGDDVPLAGALHLNPEVPTPVLALLSRPAESESPLRPKDAERHPLLKVPL
jgi:hypothetical protein